MVHVGLVQQGQSKILSQIQTRIIFDRICKKISNSLKLNDQKNLPYNLSCVSVSGQGKVMFSMEICYGSMLAISVNLMNEILILIF